jgi:competence protein ComFC
MAAAALYASIKSFIKLIFPPECLNCKTPHDKLGVPLCESCFSYLEVRPSTGEIVITFDGASPAQSLITSLKKGASSNLSSLLAAYMAVQYSKSDLPLPDVIVPVPTSYWRKWQMGQEIAAELARELAKLLDRPFLPLLQRKRQLVRQELLTRQERKYLPAEEFQWKEKHDLKGKTVLLIDDTITTGTTLACSAERLYEAHPSRIIKIACADRGYLLE